MRQRTMKNAVLIAGMAATLWAGMLERGVACTRLLCNAAGEPVVMARTMDLFMDDGAKLVARPRGPTYTSPQTTDPASWTARYGSVALTALDFGTSDGMNEKGLAVNLLYLDKSAYEPADGRKAVSVAVWAQYVLDNYATVQEALDNFDAFRIAPLHLVGHDWPMHLALEDATGDSAVIEFVAGKPVIHHGREFTVMTNEPPLDTQLANLKKYKLFGGTLGLPGDIDPQDRFVRVASFAKMLPQQTNASDAVASAVNIVRTALNPAGAIDTSGHDNSTDAWPTRWISAADMTNKLYFVQSAQSPFAVWVDLNKIDFQPGAPARSVDIYDVHLAGDVTSSFPTATAPAAK
jgi:penicillin V acylase-like amidase (Ntn superfamily)